MRRYGIEKISDRMEQVLRARDKRGVGSLCIFDIDRFKSVNDTYGHPKGDEVLRKVGEILSKGYKSEAVSVTPRKLDVICRWGGEEFIAYLDQTDEAGAVVFAERISKAVQDLEFNVGRSGETFKVTVTMGIVGFNTESLGNLPYGTNMLEHHLSFADKALYEGKETGRNRIVVYKDDGYDILETGASRA
jgi:diguanylate cyclase (GGDEF)-like protein